ncbi:MAG: S53 family peptidase [Thermoplasmata archaeon]
MKYDYIACTIITIAVLFSGIGLIGNNTHSSQTEFHSPDLYSQHISASASCTYLGSDVQLGPMNQSKMLNVLVTLEFRNASGLDNLLMNLQDPFSPQYHRYLTENQFISQFSPSYAEYASYVSFFRSEGLTVTKTFGDRVSISLTGTVSQFEGVFHTQIMLYHAPGKTFFAPDSAPSVDASFGKIASISGFSDRFTPTLSPLFTVSGSAQALYGSDFQVAYQLKQLYTQFGYPSNETVATILWAGTNKSGAPVAPYNPTDISTYFAKNLPSGEPAPSVYGYPVCGALPPGPSSQNDSTHANIESTLDLEMAGSTAPGGSVVEVYGSAPFISDLNAAFASVLSPSYNTTVNAALSKVVAISNSWGTQDCNDSTWMQYEMEAAARGITVLASSGDNGNTPSPVPSFPASMAYNDSGTLAVGGSFTKLSGTQSSNGSGTTGILSQAVWFNTPQQGNGSQGGVSKIFSEPKWQLSSQDASGVISGAASITGVTSGRGTPDIAADGANMTIYLSESGQTGYFTVDGTSIASPLVAGQIATIDHSLRSPEGFINPLLYKFGQEQVYGTLSGKPVFYFISNGSNTDFKANNGYSLAVGWGSINSYNLINAQFGHKVSFNETGLSSGKWYVNISGSSEYASAGSSIVYCLPNGSYSYNVSSTNQSYTSYPSPGNITVSGTMTVNITFKVSRFAASFDQSGLPSGTTWSVMIYNLSGNLVDQASSSTSIQFLLSNGSYSYIARDTNLDYRPVNGQGTFLVSGNNLTSITINFYPVLYKEIFTEVGMPAGYWYVNITNSSGKTFIASSNSTNITIELMNGTYTYRAGTTNRIYFNSSTETLLLSGGKPSTITVKFNIYLTQVDFNETGLPDGTSWSVTFGKQTLTSVNSSIVFYVSNSTLSFNISKVIGFYATPSNGSLTVNGHKITESITFSANKQTGIVNLNYTSILSNRVFQVFITLIALTLISAAAIAVGRRRK